MNDSDNTVRTQDAPKGVMQSAIWVTLGNVVTMAFGMMSQVIIASIFGASQETDAFITASAIPGYLQAVLINALSFVFVPAFIRAQTRGDQDDAWALTGTTMCLVGSVLTLLSIAGALSANLLVAATAPGLTVQKAQLTSNMLAIMMITVPTMGMYALSAGVQNARGKFFSPAVAPAVGAAGNLAVVVFGTRALGPLALAWGAATASTLQAAMTLFPVLRHRWKRLLPLSHSELKELGKLSLPLLLFGVFSQVTPIFERYFASGLPDGDLTCLGYAIKLSSVAYSLLGVGIATAILPDMARSYSVRGKEGLAESVSYGFKATFVYTLPVITVLAVVSTPLVEVLFERGSFSHEAALNVGEIAALPLIAVAFQMLGNISGRAYYVSKNTVTQPLIGATAAVVYCVAAGFLVQSQGFVGLAWALAIQWAFSFTASFLLLPSHARTLPIRSAIRALGTSFLAGMAAWLCLALVARLQAFWQLAIALSAGGIVFLVALYLFGDLAYVEAVLRKTLGRVRVLRPAIDKG